MRNNGGDTNLERNLDNRQSIVKNPSHKGSILYKIIDFGSEKDNHSKDEDHKLHKQTSDTHTSPLKSSEFIRLNFDSKDKENSNHYQKSFLYSVKIQDDMKDKESEIKIDDVIKDSSVVLAKKENTKLIDTIKSYSTDSRVTGGGDTATDERVSKKVHKENNATRRVSFKVRHPAAMHRKAPTEIVTTLTSSKVAALTQKFNDLIRENDNLLKKPNLAKVVNRIQNCKNKGIESNHSTPNSSMSSNVSVKILSNNKVLLKRIPSLKSKSTSNSSLDKLNKTDSPNLGRKVFRVKSESTPRKKHFTKRREIYKTLEFSFPERAKSVRDISEKYNRNSTDDVPLAVVKRRVSFKNSSNRNSTDVQATIKKFESQKKFKSELNDVSQSISKELIKPKPNIPAKKEHLFCNKSVGVVVKDGIPKLKLSKSDAANVLHNHLASHDLSNRIATEENKCTGNDLNQNLLDKTDSMKKTKKAVLPYDKYKFKHKTVHPDKIQLPMSKTCVIDPMETPAESKSQPIEIENKFNFDSNLDQCKLGEDSGISLTDDEKLYHEVTSRIKPNESFLWRSNSKLDAPETNNYEAAKCHVESDTKYCDSPISENEYDYVGPPVKIPENKDLMEVIAEELDCPSFDQFIKRADDLLITKKREIAMELRKESRSSMTETTVEAVNLFVKNSDEDIDDIAEVINMPVVVQVLKTEDDERTKRNDEGYEPLELYRTDFHSCVTAAKDIKPLTVRNGPLPQLPEPPSHSLDDTISVHTYEYCRSKNDPEKSSTIGSDGSYEYCKSPRYKNIPTKETNVNECSNKFAISVKDLRHDNISVLYESIPPVGKPDDSIYETIPAHRKSENDRKYLNHQRMIYGENYDECNYDDNIYDTIKQTDSVSNCYESIPGSPHSVIRMRPKDKYNHRALLLNKIAFDSISNFSQTSSISTVISENKTNSIYGQRSIMSFERSETTTVYGEAPSEISSSDRSDEWVDMSDQEESSEDPTIIIIREKVKRSRRSPASWSRKVRHQWNVSPKKNDFTVFISSPSIVYITTTTASPYYSDNDKVFSSGQELYQNVDAVLRLIKENKIARVDFIGLAVLKLQTLDVDQMETQEISLLIDSDSSDKEHLYESLSQAHSLIPYKDLCPASYADDIDSFDSDSDVEGRPYHITPKHDLDIHNAQLPEPPTSSNIYTLTKFASAAGKKMRQIKSNFTKSTRKKSTTEEDKNLNAKAEKEMKKSKRWTTNKDNAKSSQYASHNAINANTIDKSPTQVPFNETTNSNFPVRNAVSNINLSNALQLNLELMSALNDRKLKSDNSNESVNTSANTSSDVSISPVANNKSEKDSIVLTRKYLSFKSKFKRATSAIETDSSTLSLSLTNSVFYLNDLDESQTHKSMQQLNADESLNSSTKVKKSSQEKLPVIETVPSNGNLQKTSPNSIRKSVTSIKSVMTRPSAPPPPPPIENINGDKKAIVKKDKKNGSTSSWYAECGLFKATEPYKPETNGQANNRKSSASWYSEVGLYQIGNISSSSSNSNGSYISSAGGTSTTTVASSPTPLPHPLGMFNQEPLYQFYNAAKLESVCREIVKDSDLESDGYEEIANFRESQQTGDSNKTYQRPSAMTLINPQKGPSRTLWCEIPEVINSGILDALPTSRKKLQEAMFEIITSEASYLNSLTVLESQFLSHPTLQDSYILTDSDSKNLFGNVMPVKQCSEQLLSDLEQCWQDSILLRGLCKIIHNHAEKNFHVYVNYCEGQVFLIKTLKKLKQDDKFNDVLLQVQSKPACQGLSLHSFLMLPMQRITRLPLLLDAVLKNLEKSDDEYHDCLNALSMLNTVVSQCNEGTRKMERVEEMTRISKMIDFPPHIRKIPILTEDINPNKLQRWLVRSGELTQLVWRGDEQSKLTFGKKFTKISLHLFLFTDLLIVTKKKSEELYTVVDYCKRSLLELTTMGQAPVKETAGKHVMLLTMLENCENKTVEMLLSCVSESDRQRWMEACIPPPSDNPNETIYEGWDCPQVVAMYSYQTTQPDELNLQQGDIVNVTKKMADGWYHGERISDGEKGWFPGNYTVEIASQHVRAKNLRQRYRLLALTGSYLGQKKK